MDRIFQLTLGPATLLGVPTSLDCHGCVPKKGLGHFVASFEKTCSLMLSFSELTVSAASWNLL